jgi:hypothetical protein
MRSTRLSNSAPGAARVLHYIGRAALYVTFGIVIRAPCWLLTRTRVAYTYTRASAAPCRSQRSHVTEYDAPQAHTQYLAHDMNIRRDNQEYATPVLRRCARQPCAA